MRETCTNAHTCIKVFCYACQSFSLQSFKSAEQQAKQRSKQIQTHSHVWSPSKTPVSRFCQFQSMMEKNSKTVKIVPVTLLLLTTVTLEMFNYGQWFSTACLLYSATVSVKLIFSLLDPKHSLNLKEIAADFSWKVVFVLLLAFEVKTSNGAGSYAVYKEYCLFLGALFIIRCLNIQRNNCEDIRLMERGSLASDSARTTFSYLENIIKGKEDTMAVSDKKNMEKGCFFEKKLKEHFEKEKITNGIVFPKLVLLFPESNENYDNGKALGSVLDILQKERQDGSKHTLDGEKISYQYYAKANRIRQAQLEVIKFRTEEGLVYLTVSENRLLNTFYCMLSEPCINFGLE